jgi:uncharacterized protein DUF3455
MKYVRSVLAAWFCCACCWAQSPARIVPPEVDPALVPKGGLTPLMAGHTTAGVQIYTCKGGVWDADHPEPDAVLISLDGVNIVAHHYFTPAPAGAAAVPPAGPTWEYEGSKIVAKKLDPVQKKDGTIPWLLLQVIHHEGNGPLSRITYVQRVKTSGGTPPATACDTNAAPPQRIRVPYEATYYFWGPSY